jgi:hydrogenase nickel insertion protein HypA
MHEFALADAVVRAAQQEAQQAGIDRLERIAVKVGRLQRISRELFEFSLTEVMPAVAPELSGVEIEIEEEAVLFRCRVCALEFGEAEIADSDDEAVAEAMHFVPELCHAFIRCPGCGSPDFEIVAGRGVTLELVEGLAAAGEDER